MDDLKININQIVYYKWKIPGCYTQFYCNPQAQIDYSYQHPPHGEIRYQFEIDEGKSYLYFSVNLTSIIGKYNQSDLITTNQDNEANDEKGIYFRSMEWLMEDYGN